MDLAIKGAGKVSPNPMVGAVIVKDGEIIGEGYHRYHGDRHAEVNAILSCSKDPSGGDLYCNLEPCSTDYPGKINPPCCDAIIKCGIKNVFIGQLDPNPKVSGSGVERLEGAGINVRYGVCEAEALELNRGFNSVMLQGRPYVHIKWAQSLDGQTATKDGASKWITSEECRKETHWHRSKCDAIMVGRKTIESDNPTLNARYGYYPSPRPVVVDSELKCNPDSEVFKHNPIMFTSSESSEKRRALFNGDICLLAGKRFSIKAILEELKLNGINSLFVEGGANLISQFMNEGLWDRITVYTAPKIMGDGLSPVGEIGVKHPEESIEFAESSFEVLDGHMVFNGFRKRRELCLQD